MSEPRPLDRAALDAFRLPAIEGGDKDSHGRVLIVAGSRDVPGAALLAAHGAMRSGAGKLQIAAPDLIAVPLGIAMPEAMVVGHASHRDGGFATSAIDALGEMAARADAVIAGPGLESNNAAAPLALILLGLGKPLALDAALLHVLPDCAAACRAARLPPILLPHAGEMASLLGCGEAEVDADPLDAGRRCAAHYNALVLAKGVRSHIIAPDGSTWRYAGGGPGLGISGSGDALAGIVGGLLARGADPLTALLWAVWLHGEAGCALARKVGPLGFLAREIPGEVPALLPP